MLKVIGQCHSIVQQSETTPTQKTLFFYKHLKIKCLFLVFFKIVLVFLRRHSQNELKKATNCSRTLKNPPQQNCG